MRFDKKFSKGCPEFKALSLKLSLHRSSKLLLGEISVDPVNPYVENPDVMALTIQMTTTMMAPSQDIPTMVLFPEGKNTITRRQICFCSQLEGLDESLTCNTEERGLLA